MSPNNGSAAILSDLYRFFRILICLAIFFLPTIYMDLLVRKKSDATFDDGSKGLGRSKAGVAIAREMYYAAVFAFLLVALFWDFHTSIIAIGLIIYFLADILIHLSGQVFVWGVLSIDASRSLLLALINYFEMTIGFAVLYRHWDCLSICPLGAMQALYFSLVTGATVGYGDIVPATDAGKTLVMVQIAIAFLFVAIILSTLLGRTDRLKSSCWILDLNVIWRFSQRGRLGAVRLGAFGAAFSGNKSLSTRLFSLGLPTGSPTSLG